jgi:hypothetical protein
MDDKNSLQDDNPNIAERVYQCSVDLMIHVEHMSHTDRIRECTTDRHVGSGGAGPAAGGRSKMSLSATK